VKFTGKKIIIFGGLMQHTDEVHINDTCPGVDELPSRLEHAPFVECWILDSWIAPVTEISCKYHGWACSSVSPNAKG